MKRISRYLQVITVLIGVGAIAFLLWEPHIEGRNAHSTIFEIYFNDSFLTYAYIASIPFFMIIYQVFKVLGYSRNNNLYSHMTVKALRVIKYWALYIVGFAAIGEIFIMLGDSDDRAGGVFMGILIAFGSSAVAIAAAMFEKNIKKTVEIEFDKKLTV